MRSVRQFPNKSMGTLAFIDSMHGLPDDHPLRRYALLARHADDPDVRDVLVKYGNMLLDTATTQVTAKLTLEAVAAYLRDWTLHITRQDAWELLARAAVKTRNVAQLDLTCGDLRYEIQQELLAVIALAR